MPLFPNPRTSPGSSPPMPATVSPVSRAGDSPALAAVRSALEDALGVRFEGERGAAFFRSTLVQTLFYGVFSAWVLWARQVPPPTGSFNWHEAVWHLRAPVLRALFQQLSDPGRLRPLGLVEVLDWTAAALDRVDQEAFFTRFDASMSPSGSGSEAVPYFYEPFLEAFDPRLRKQLGVWYTPNEVVRYMVARVDRALKDDLGIADGLAADNVYVLDPCCGTGAYLAEVLRRIAENLRGQGLGALTGARVKRAATERVFGFEIMPAPFVIAHLQVGLTMQALDAPLADDGNERAGVFLTNALTGWEPRAQPACRSPSWRRSANAPAGSSRTRRSSSSSAIRPTTASPAWPSTRSASFRKPTASPSGSAGPGPGTKRPLRPLLPHGRAAHRREDRPGRRLLHLQLLLARWTVVHRHARALPWRSSTRSASTASTATSTTGKTRQMAHPTPASSPREDSHQASKVGTAIATLVRKALPRAGRDASASATLGPGQARELTRRQALLEPAALYGLFAIGSKSCPSACRSRQCRSATLGSTGRPCRICFRHLSRGSRPTATRFWWILTSSRLQVRISRLLQRRPEP